MSAKILYLPGAREEQLASRIVELGNLIRNDINRCLRYKNIDPEISKKTQLLLKKTQQRIFARLEKVAKVPTEYGLTNEEFDAILKKVLKKIDTQSPDLQQKFETLRATFHNDTTTTKVLALGALMGVLGVPQNQFNIPFHP